MNAYLFYRIIDQRKNKRRLMFSSAQKDTHVTELHARIPLTILRRHMVLLSFRMRLKIHVGHMKELICDFSPKGLLTAFVKFFAFVNLDGFFSPDFVGGYTTNFSGKRGTMKF